MIMSKTIKLLRVHFDNYLTSKMVPAFRGAIIEKVNRSHILFHHHQGDQAVLYKYPLIQYKSIKNKPCIVCMDQGAEELYRLMNQPNLNIQLQEKKMALVVDEVQMKRFELKFSTQKQHYRITNWLALNEQNFNSDKNLPSELDQVAHLERILIGNILAFAKGVDWQIEEQIKLEILEISQQRIIRFKGKPLVAFDLTFSCNVILPNYIGLGKSASHGYGFIKQQKIN